jgi:hypothetical protein
MRATPAALLVLAAALALAGCGGSSSGICDCRLGEVCVRGRCFPGDPEPLATRATCGPFTQTVGTVPNPEPAAGQCTAAVQSSTAPPEFPIRRYPDQPVGTTLTFDVPPGTASITIVLQAVSVPATTVTFLVPRPPPTPPTTFRINNTAVPLTIRAPDGAIWYDATQPAPADGFESLVFFASDAPVVGTLTLPNTTRSLELSATGGLPAGTWSFVVSDLAYECTLPARAAGCGPAVAPPAEFALYATGRYDAQVVLKPGARPSPGRLDVAFYLHGCPGASYTGTTCNETPLRAATATTDPDAQRMLATYASLMAGAGLCLGTVTWYDLPEWAQTRWAQGLDLDATACDAGLGQLLQLSQPGNAMNLFLLPAIVETSSPDLASTVGLDGTIPGPATVSATVQSGAVVSAANLRANPQRCGAGLGLVRPACGADVTSYIAAHETGHFLGLYHTAEQSGTAFDPLGDTPQCRCDTCAPEALRGQCGSAAVQIGTAGECNQSTLTCGGVGNLMFWVLTSSSAAKVSPQQSELMRANPLVR